MFHRTSDPSKDLCSSSMHLIRHPNEHFFPPISLSQVPITSHNSNPDTSNILSGPPPNESHKWCNTYTNLNCFIVVDHHDLLILVESHFGREQLSPILLRARFGDHSCRKCTIIFSDLIEKTQWWKLRWKCFSRNSDSLSSLTACGRRPRGATYDIN
jgi:hypothetical protein